MIFSFYVPAASSAIISNITMATSITTMKLIFKVKQLWNIMQNCSIILIVFSQTFFFAINIADSFFSFQI